MQCMENCATSHPHGHCFANCACGSGVITITPQKVNTFAIVAEEYGDVTNLSEEEVERVNEVLNTY